VRLDGRGDVRAEQRKLLVDLRRMAMTGNAVGDDVLVDGHEVRALRGGAAGARDAGLHVDDDVGDRARPRQGRERQQRRDRKAAGIGDEIGLRQHVGVQLRQAVDRAAEQVGRAVLAIPGGVGRAIAQAKVRRQVHDAHAALAQRRDDRRRGAVGIGDDGGVDVAVTLDVELLEHRADAMVRVQLAERPAGVAAARHGVQRELRMAIDEPRGERARVARGAGDEHLRRASHAAHRPARRRAARRSARAQGRRRRR
jgi:hypothetical protein